MKKTLLFILFGLCLFLMQQIVAQTTVQSWQTSSNQSKRFERQSDVDFKDGSGSNSIKINIDETTTYQTIDGFGWAMTQGSAYWLMQLTQANRTAILKELFSLEDNDQYTASSSMRIAIGASDLGQGVYTYRDNQSAPFSLAGPDLDYLIPVLKEVVAINPNIRIMASPWTAPPWMKTNNAYIGGNLRTDCYAAYADYFLNYFQAMEDQGIKIYAVTIQNEPLHDGNNPSMYMSKEQQYDFAQNYLGPKMAASKFKDVKIIGYDHNCDNTDYPIYVAQSQYVEGTAFHLYGGSIEAMTTVYNATKKSVYFTEQWTGGNADFASDFNYHMQYVQLGSVRNYGKTAYAWNVASDQNWQPHTNNGGCDLYKGAITINSSTKAITRQPTFYTAAQMSKVAKQGALRIKSTSGDSDLLEAAFANPDGSAGLVVFNKGGAQKSFDVVFNGKYCSYTLAGNTVASLIWKPVVITVPVQSVTVSPETAALEARKTVQLSATVLPANATLKTVRWSSNNENVATVDMSSGLVRGLRPGTAVITVTTMNEQKTDFCTVTVTASTDPNPFPDVYNLISVYSSKGLDVKDMNEGPGASLQQWAIDGVGGPNQQWTFESAGGDLYYIRSFFANKYYITATGAANGAGVVQQPFIGDNTQEWEITYLSSSGNGDVYKMINTYSSKALDVSGPSTADGAEVHLWDYVDGDNQKWLFKVARVSTNEVGIVGKETIAIYPNPASDVIYIKGLNPEYRYVCKIIGLDGRIVQTVNLNESKNIVDVSSLQPAYYIVELTGQPLSESKLLNFIKIK
ncbi:MAG: RICIN domain-containing protein [Candidatus Azobacteroides sp.]|nr:RICIN domain-containing protein [Candidatus Azobacteroides sp.]